MPTTEELLASVPMFADLSPKELKSVAKLMTSLDVEAGRELMTQGKTGNEFIVFLDGAGEVLIDGEKVATLGPGDFVGEVSLVTNDVRMATVRTTAPSKIEVLSNREFNSLLDANPSVAKKVLITAIRRLQKAENRTSA